MVSWPQWCNPEQRANTGLCGKGVPKLQEQQDRGRCSAGSRVDKDACIRQQTSRGSAPVKQHFQTTHIPKIPVFICFSVYLVL